MSRILIVSQPDDAHAFLVLEALERKGAEVIYCHTPDFPSALEKSILFDGEGFRLGLRGKSLDALPLDVDAVWWRRPSAPVLPASLHPEDREFAAQECRFLYQAFWNFLTSGKTPPFCVNPVEASSAANHKPLQQRAALGTALEVPATLYSNDPKEIRDFLAEQGGRAIYKVFRSRNNHWRQDDGSYRFATTAVLTEATLPGDDEVLSAAPGIFQALVPKRHELRVTVMGEHVFAAKLDSQATEDGQLDWRRAYHELPVSPTELPPEIAAACVQVVRRLGLVFGALDLIVTPEGQYVFLEVNESGNFLWVEAMGGPALLDPFCEMLYQARRDFTWPGPTRVLRRDEVYEAAARRQRRAEQEHVLEPLPESRKGLRRAKAFPDLEPGQQAA